jgi:hypothetical protein
MKPAEVYKRFMRGESLAFIGALGGFPVILEDVTLAEAQLRKYLNARDKRRAKAKRGKVSKPKVAS